MVRFGERLIALRAPGWEKQYLKYASLKKQIGLIISASPEEQAALSKSFFDDLCQQLAAASLRSVAEWAVLCSAGAFLFSSLPCTDSLH